MPTLEGRPRKRTVSIFDYAFRMRARKTYHSYFLSQIEPSENLEAAQKLQEQLNKTEASIRSPTKKRTIIDALRNQSSKKSCRRAASGLKFSGNKKTHALDFEKNNIEVFPRCEEEEDDDFSFSSAALNSRRQKEEVENDKVTELVAMGFSRDSSERALRDSEGDPGLAVSMLLSENG